MAERFKDKVAVVTGAGRGIGRATALLLAQEGASVVVNDLGCEVDGSSASHAPADAVVEEITSAGGVAVANYDDVSEMSGGEAVVKTAVDSFGGINMLVNSIGVLKDRMIFEMSPEEFGLLVRNNLKGMFAPTKYASILFRQQRSGHIVNMTSDAGLGDIGRSNYAATSEGIIGLTRTVARDIGKYGATCNAISPLASTRLFPGSVDEFREQMSPPFSATARAGFGDIPLHEVWDDGEPDDPRNVAALAAFLCTDALPNMNGRTFGIRRGSIFLYSEPAIEKSIFKGGVFTLDELDAMVPRSLGRGVPSLEGKWGRMGRWGRG